MHLNHKQTSVLALTLAAIATAVFLHNPFAGYANSTYWLPAGGKYEWQSLHHGCTSELRQELSALEAAELASFIAAAEGKAEPDTRSPIQRAVDSMTGRRGQIYKQCMKYVESAPVLRDTPLLDWRSNQAYFWELGQVQTLLILVALLGFWGVVIAFIFRTPAPRDRGT